MILPLQIEDRNPVRMRNPKRLASPARSCSGFTRRTIWRPANDETRRIIAMRAEYLVHVSRMQRTRTTMLVLPCRMMLSGDIVSLGRRFRNDVMRALIEAWPRQKDLFPSRLDSVLECRIRSVCASRSQHPELTIKVSCDSRHEHKHAGRSRARSYSGVCDCSAIVKEFSKINHHALLR